jgi:phage terminase small subunit
MPLRPKQQRFVDEYLIDLNATQAAIRAGYSARVAYHQGYENLKKPHIQAAIQTRRQELHAQCEVTQATVVQELARIAFSDLRTYVQWGPDGVRLEPSTTLTPAQARVVCLVSQTVTKDGGTLRLKLHDKVSALDKLARHLGLYTETPDRSAPLAMAQAADEARERLTTRLDAMHQQAEAQGERGFYAEVLDILHDHGGLHQNGSMPPTDREDDGWEK